MIMIMVQDGLRSDPASEPHPRQPLGVGQQLIGEDWIDISKVGCDQGNERPNDDRCDHAPISGTRISEEPSGTQGQGHHRERDHRDRVEEEQRSGVEGEPGQPTGQYADDGMPKRQSRWLSRRWPRRAAQERRPTTARRTDAEITEMQLSGPSAAVGSGLDVVDRVEPDRAGDDRPAGRVGA